MEQKYDLLLRGGEVIDPAQDLRGRLDVALARGKVALVAKDIPKEQARRVEDVGGKLVTPGLIDIHGHFYPGAIPLGIDPDQVCLPNGVTTAVDGGSSGWANFAGLRDFVMARSQTRLYCFLHISALGLVFFPYMEELADLSLAEVEKAAECIDQNRDLILGVKVRVDYLATGKRNALPALELALQAAEKTRTRLMVHVSGCPVPLGEVLNRLRPGDIATHIFNGRENNILDWDHEVCPEVRRAVERGVLLDASHGRSHHDHNVARAALEQGLWPHTLSTDIIDRSIFDEAAAYNLPEVMSLFLALGLPLEEAVRCTTSNAAAAIGRSQELGNLRPGAAGDVAVLELQEGDFGFIDSTGSTLKVRQKLAPVMTVHGGQIYRASS